jgi:hypothetical protein
LVERFRPARLLLEMWQVDSMFAWRDNNSKLTVFLNVDDKN